MWRRRLSLRSLVALLVAVVISCLAAIPDPTWDATTRPPPTLGSFRVECELARQRRVDPIVSWGKPSVHMHDFFGNTTVVATSTYESLRAGTSNCSTGSDHSGYWTPTLMAPNGDRVRPERGVIYYRNRPVSTGRTLAFPRGLRIVAGGMFPHAYWTCEGESDAALEARKAAIPDCAPNGKIKAHVIFPSCWDGKKVDSADHRSHLAYGLNSSGQRSDTEATRCPPSHPVKLPQLDVRVLYAVSDGRNYRLADGNVLPHADFFDAWSQRELDDLVDECLGRVGRSCGLADDR